MFRVRLIQRRLRRALVATLAPLILIGGGLLVFAPSAMANCCFVKSGGSPNADSISTLYDVVFGLGVAVFVSVMAVLLYAVWKFRAHKHPVALQIHGNTKVELGLTAGACGLLVILTIVTFVMLPGIVNPPNSNAGAVSLLSASLTAPNAPNGKELTVCVTGRQFIWRYTYGAKCTNSAWIARLPYSYQEMVVPAGETVKLVIQSSDVIHAWWVPSLGGKVDAVPGFTTYTWFKAPKSGELYHGQCAQLCGREHAFMTALVKVVTPTQYKTWLASQGKLIGEQNDQVSALRQELIKDGYLTSSGIF
ncbi:MAG: cytochrome c oxidase subunit II [Solirubrobacteraceae bacterium]